MYVRRCPDVACPHCGSDLRYGVKEEPARWKVFVACTDDRCGREYRGGSIPRDDVSDIDDVYEIAERRCGTV